MEESKKDVSKKDTLKGCEKDVSKKESPKVQTSKSRGRPLKYDSELSREERIKLSKDNYRTKQKELYDTFSEGQKKLMKLLTKKKVEEDGEVYISKLIEELERLAGVS